MRQPNEGTARALGVGMGAADELQVMHEQPQF